MRARLAVAAALALVLPAAGCRHAPRRGAAPAPEKREAPDTRAEKGVPPKGARPRVPAGPEALLAPGAVGKLQRALADRGLLGQHEAGELDDATSAAIRRFQEGEGLAATGFPDRETLAKLGIAPEDAYGR